MYPLSHTLDLFFVCTPTIVRMPRRSARIAQRIERYAEDRYYEWLYAECHCDPIYYGYDDEVEICPYCVQQAEKEEERLAAWRAQLAAQPAAQRWSQEIAFIRGKLNASEAAASTEAKLSIIRELFTALLGYDAFLAAQPKFRNAVRNKIAELQEDQRAEALSQVMNQVTQKLDQLVQHDEYKN